MIDSYTSILEYKGDDLKDYLSDIGLLPVFQPLAREFKDKTIFSGAVKFILYSYSLQSELLHTVGNTWLKLSKTIYDKSGLPDNEDIFDKITNLKIEGLRESIEEWLKWNNSEPFTQYCHYRDLRKQCLQTSMSGEKLKERMEALTYSKELLEMMEEAKSGFIENKEALKISIDALPKNGKKKVTTVGPQNYSK